MKQRITIEDLQQLSQGQQQSLAGLWAPKPYDVAVVVACTDVINEKYEYQPFVIDHVHVELTTDTAHIPALGFSDDRHVMQLYDLEYKLISADDSADHDPIVDWYDKEDCLPLLTIGDMLAILQKAGFTHGNFVIESKEGRVMVGGSPQDVSEVDELCDWLWQAILPLL